MNIKPPEPTREGTDFGLEQYKLDREHELELNRATAVYEHAWIRTVTLLNGGAAGAFVTLLGAVWKAGDHPWTALAFSALAMWACGLVTVTAATNLALRAQGGYADGFRYKRKVEEVRRFEGDPQRFEYMQREMLAKLKKIDKEKPLTGLDILEWSVREAQIRFEKANKNFSWSNRLNWIAIVLFMIGVSLSAASIMFPERNATLVVKHFISGATV